MSESHYPICVGCNNEIFEGRIFKCYTCNKPSCLNCVEMIAGYDFCVICTCKGLAIPSKY